MKRTIGLLFASLLCTLNAQADSVSFPDVGASTSATGTNGTISGTILPGGLSAYMWTAGDYVRDTFTVPSLTAVASISDTFRIVNGLEDSLTVNVLINGVNVGSWAALGCPGFCNYDQTINFSSGPFGPIVGNGSYTLEFMLANTLDAFGGSIAFHDGGIATLTAPAAVPEPETYSMMLAGLGLLGFMARRRK